MRAIRFMFRFLLKIVMAPVVLLLTIGVWVCVGLVYVSGLVLGLLSSALAFLGVCLLVIGPRHNGVIVLVIAFLLSPYGLPLAAIWLLGKVQDLKFAIQNKVCTDKNAALRYFTFPQK